MLVLKWAVKVVLVTKRSVSSQAVIYQRVFTSYVTEGNAGIDKWRCFGS